MASPLQKAKLFIYITLAVKAGAWWNGRFHSVSDRCGDLELVERDFRLVKILEDGVGDDKPASRRKPRWED